MNLGSQPGSHGVRTKVGQRLSTTCVATERGPGAPKRPTPRAADACTDQSVAEQHGAPWRIEISLLPVALA
jgi:hypothetical protein